MKLLPLLGTGVVSYITIDFPDGRYRHTLGSRDAIFKRGQYLYRDYSTGPDDFFWDLLYLNPRFRDYDNSTIYEGPEDTV